MTLHREAVLHEIAETKQWDVLVIGGGASGLGVALEAASRGYRTLLVERHDFAKGSSSRSTKLVHGGVRYLEQLQIRLVLEALRERGYMLRNAPHLVHQLPFVVPVYRYLGLPYYGLGLKVYEWLAGNLSFGRARILSRAETLKRLPTITHEGLKGGILYRDGQFDDARYAIALLRTLGDADGVAINYMEAVSLLQRDGKTVGIHARDRETDNEADILARVVVNATGVFAEDILRMDDPGSGSLLVLSQGTHFVLPESWLPGGNALIVPKTTDGRVLFAIPWHQHLVVGTTDEPVLSRSEEPCSMAREREFLAAHIRRYLGRQLTPEDVLSVWSGLRPLLHDGNVATSKLSRDYKILISKSGLVTVAGGKWTTYRRMGEDAINSAASVAQLPAAPSRTRNLKLHGWSGNGDLKDAEEYEWTYGSDLPALQTLGDSGSGMNDLLHPRLSYRAREVVWAARYEMARTVEDVLARRTRALFLDARAAMEAAPKVACLLAQELCRNASWVEKNVESFRELARGYIYHE